MAAGHTTYTFLEGCGLSGKTIAAFCTSGGSGPVGQSLGWNFTLLGHVDGVAEPGFREVLNAGGGNVSVTFSLDEPIRTAGQGRSVLRPRP